MTQPTAFTWPSVLMPLIERRDITAEQAGWAMDRIMAGEASDAQIAAFMIALRAKGESVDELRGLADRMLAHAVRFEVDGPTVDIVGTGGDRAHTVNISTMAAIVCAGTGLRVVKHGNRAASSSSGSADVLEALGVRLDLPVEEVARAATRVGITFCFAQRFHPALRHAATARRDLAVPSSFNFLGPLTNPAQPTYSAIGCADPRMADLMAGVIARRGKAAAVFRGDDGLDELTLATTSTLWWVRAGQVRRLSVDPADLGLGRQPVEALRGGSPADNAEVVRRLLAGQVGAVRDAVLLNAGIALALAAASPTEDPTEETLREMLAAGVARAGAAIDDGSAAAVLERWVRHTQEAG